MAAPLADPDDLSPFERISRPFQVFARFKASGAIVLLLAAVAALIWANSSGTALYQDLLGREVVVGYGELRLAKPLLLWINDALMGVFFFVVGLEIKREVLAGELTSLRSAMLPIAGAIGGMAVPAALFWLLNPALPDARGWGIPMATDIAFALGMLALLGARVPLGLKVFLTALAIVDDLGAVIVIAVFYTDQVALPVLAIGGGLLALSALLNVLGLRNAIIYFIIGSLVWLAFLKSGVHATLAAVLMAMTIPAQTRIHGERFARGMSGLLERLRSTGLPRDRRLLSTDQQNILQHMEHAVDHMTAPLQQIEHALVPYVTFFVIPVFALANAGVVLGGDGAASVTDPIALGVAIGLVVGKQLGVFGFAWLAVRAGIAQLPEGVDWRQIHAVSVLAGIGFTMSLFVAGLAYDDSRQVSSAKLGILLASGVATIGGLALLWAATRRRPGAAAAEPERD